MALITLAILLWIAARIERILTIMATRADLDTAIAGLPGIIGPAVATAVEAVLDPFVQKLENAPEDFSDEIQNLQNLGPTLAQSVAEAVSSHLQATLPPSGPSAS